MKLRLFIIFSLLTITTFGQRDLKSSVHLTIETGLNTSTVKALTQGALGQIWIGTQTGLQRWDGRSLQAIDEIDELVISLGSQSKSVYCLTVKSLYRINTLDNEVSFVPMKTSDLRECVFVENGILIISRDRNDTIMYDYSLNVRSVEDDYSTASLYVKDVHYDLSSNTFLNDYLQYNEDIIFGAAQEGLIEYSQSNDASIIHLEEMRIECLLKDFNNNLWVGTAEKGLFMFHRNVIEQEYYEILANDGSPAICWGITEVRDQVFVATSEGVKRVDTMGMNSSPIEIATEGMFCFSIHIAKNFFLVGTATDGLYRFENGRLSQIYFNTERPLDNTIVQIFKRKNGFYVLTKIGFIELNELGFVLKSEKFPVYKEYIMDMQSIESGYLAATINGVKYYTVDMEVETKLSDSSAVLFSAISKYQGINWVASMDNGLFYIKNKTLHHVEGPNSQLITLSTYNDRLWMSSFSNVAVYDGEKFQVFDRRNGFPIQEYNQLGLHVSKNKHLLIAGVGGVFRINSSEVLKAQSLPRLVLRNKNKPYSTKKITTLQHLQSTILISVDAAILSDQNSYIIEYKLNEKWKAIENHSIFSSKIDYGESKLVFRIRNLISGEEEVSELHFNREVPYWMQSWFIVLWVLVLFAAIVGMFFFVKFFRTRKLHRQEVEQGKIMKERLRISRELHDNIGARLSHIISSIDIELHQKNNNQLETINSFARETMGQLRETIWAVSDNTIFFSELLLRVEQYIFQSNKLSDIKIVFRKMNFADFELNATQTINVFRIIQESINNSLKYSQAKTIECSIHEESKFIIILIADDGIGFDLANSEFGNGINNMRSRALEIEAKLDVISSPNDGTTVKLVFN